MLKVCIDTNVWLSGIVFAGRPGEVVAQALDGKFDVVLSQFIIDEIKKNLLVKFGYTRWEIRSTLDRIFEISSLYKPTGSVKIIPDNRGDNMVLETAHMGHAKYLVTGDKKDLLSLKMYKYVKIVDVAEFLNIVKE